MPKFRQRKGLEEAASKIINHYRLHPEEINAMAELAIMLAEAYTRVEHQSTIREIVPGSLLHSLEKQNIINAGLSEHFTLFTVHKAAQHTFPKSRVPNARTIHRWVYDGRYSRKLKTVKIKNILWTTVEEFKDFYWRSGMAKRSFLREIAQKANYTKYFSKMKSELSGEENTQT